MIACTGGLCLALATSPAPPSHDLRWTAPAGCPAQDALEQQIAALLADHAATTDDPAAAPAGSSPSARPSIPLARPDRSASAPATSPSTPATSTDPAAAAPAAATLTAPSAPPVAPAEPRRISFRVERRGAQWQLHGEVAGPGGGRRELTASTCAELVEAAALITAIAIDPSLAGPAIVPPPSEPTPAIPVTPQPVPVPREPAGPAPAITPTLPPITDAPPPPRPPRFAAQLGLAGGLGLAALPAPAALLRALVGLRAPAWSIGLQTDLWLPRDGLVADATPEVGGRFTLVSLGARACAHLRAGPVELPLCAAISLGTMTGRGIGALMESRRQRSLWAGASAGPGLRVPIRGRLGFTLAAELLVMLARPRFEIAGHGRACCDAPVGGQFTAGLDLRLR